MRTKADFVAMEKKEQYAEEPARAAVRLVQTILPTLADCVRLPAYVCVCGYDAHIK